VTRGGVVGRRRPGGMGVLGGAGSGATGQALGDLAIRMLDLHSQLRARGVQ
jgi:hypothetical protein